MSWMPSEVVFLHVSCEMRDGAHGYAQVCEAECDAACGVSVQWSAVEGTWPGARGCTPFDAFPVYHGSWVCVFYFFLGVRFLFFLFSMRFDENSFADTKTFVRQRRGGIGL